MDRCLFFHLCCRPSPSAVAAWPEGVVVAIAVASVVLVEGSWTAGLAPFICPFCRAQVDGALAWISFLLPYEVESDSQHVNGWFQKLAGAWWSVILVFTKAE